MPEFALLMLREGHDSGIRVRGLRESVWNLGVWGLATICTYIERSDRDLIPQPLAFLVRVHEYFYFPFSFRYRESPKRHMNGVNWHINGVTRAHEWRGRHMNGVNWHMNGVNSWTAGLSPPSPS